MAQLSARSLYAWMSTRAHRGALTCDDLCRELKRDLGDVRAALAILRDLSLVIPLVPDGLWVPAWVVQFATAPDVAMNRFDAHAANVSDDFMHAQITAWKLSPKAVLS